MSNRERKSRLIRNYYLFIRDFFRDLFDDRLGFYAASMSWSTLFFIIPFLMIILVTFTYLPIFDTAYAKVHDFIAKTLLPANSKMVMDYIDTFVANADKLGIIGFLYTAVAAILFFRDYDFIVNDIFETPRRGLAKALRIYSLLVLLVPLVTWISYQLSSLAEKSFSGSFSFGFLHLKYTLSYIVVWGLFYIAYQLSPRIRIPPSMALVSSFIASLVWYLAKSVFIYYILYNKTYSGIYGSLSTVLFLFLWIYISWAIFLHGLRFCYLLSKEEEIEKI